MIGANIKRPRNVDWKRAAAILYGDWGTSKAYVIGLAFAVGGYASFWLIAAMCVLTALVGLNYMVICRLYPDPHSGQIPRSGSPCSAYPQ